MRGRRQSLRIRPRSYDRHKLLERNNVMNRPLTGKLIGLCLGIAVLFVASTAGAQSVVVYDVPQTVTTYYAPSTPVTSYYAPTTAYYAPTTTYYAPTTSYYAPTTTYYAPTPTTTYYAPTTTYYAPTTAYYAPTTSYYAPTTTYYAPTPVTSYYAPTTVYSPGVVYSSKVYVAGQPVRNFFRAVTP